MTLMNSSIDVRILISKKCLRIEIVRNVYICVDQLLVVMVELLDVRVGEYREIGVVPLKACAIEKRERRHTILREDELRTLSRPVPSARPIHKRHVFSVRRLSALLPRPMHTVRIPVRTARVPGVPLLRTVVPHFTHAAHIV